MLGGRSVVGVVGGGCCGGGVGGICMWLGDNSLYYLFIYLMRGGELCGWGGDGREG